jgi:DNA-binding SARP family transcriptional activator
MILVHTLGTALIEVGTERVTPSAHHRFALLLYLSAQAGRRVPRTLLNELIFPGHPEEDPTHSLRELIYRLRRAGVQIATEHDTVQLAAEGASTDYGAVIGAERLEPAQLKAIAGGFLPGYAPEDAEAFTEWLEAFRAQTTLDLSRAASREVRRGLEVCDWTAAEQAARACLVLDPANEDATFAVAEMLALSGAKTQAIEFLNHYLGEIGETSRELRLPAVLLKRRISERPADAYISRDVLLFAGRDHEIRVLREHFKHARAGSNECVAVVGEAGIGKSRLVKEFCAAATFGGASVAVATSLPHDVRRPFGAFADLLPSLIAMRGALGCSPESMRILERLTKAPAADTGSFADTVRDSAALCDSLVRAILDLVDAVAGEQLLVLAVEDVHWLDGMSLRVLGYLLSRHRTRKLFVLVTSRTSAPIADISRYAEAVRVLDIGGLPSDAIDRLTSAFAVQSDIALDDEMKQWLEDTSTGNPLFLESLLAHYSRTRERFAISPTLANLLSRRVELLSPHAATTLQICAMLGKHATLDALMDALSLSRSDLIRAVGELETARLIKSDAENIHPAHALIADVAQARLNPIERRLAHQCVALALETRLTQDRSVDVVWECAEHWVAAHDAGRALAALCRCATQASELGRPSEAAQILARALDLELSSEDRKLIGRQVVLAADAGGEPMLVFKGYEAMGDRGKTRAHDELEFAHFKACLTSSSENTDREEDLFICILAMDATPDHRVTAAMSIAKYADVHGDKAMAERAIVALPTEVLHLASPTVRLEFLMVKHCVLGEWDDAANAARALQRFAQAGTEKSHIRLGLNGALVLGRSGCSSEALEAANAAYTEATLVGSRRAIHRAALFQSELLYDIGEDRLAEKWLQHARDSFENDPTAIDDFGLTIAYLGLALLGRDAASARILFDGIASRGLFARTANNRRCGEAFAIRLRQLEGGVQISDEELRRLARSRATTPGQEGVRETEISAACHGLLLMGRRAEARQLLDDYLRSGRVTRRALNRELQDLGRELAPEPNVAT